MAVARDDLGRVAWKRGIEVQVFIATISQGNEKLEREHEQSLCPNSRASANNTYWCCASEMFLRLMAAARQIFRMPRDAGAV